MIGATDHGPVHVAFDKAAGAWVLWYSIRPVFVSCSLVFIMIMAKNLS